MASQAGLKVYNENGNGVIDSDYKNFIPAMTGSIFLTSGNGSQVAQQVRSIIIPADIYPVVVLVPSTAGFFPCATVLKRNNNGTYTLEFHGWGTHRYVIFNGPAPATSGYGLRVYDGNGLPGGRGVKVFDSEFEYMWVKQRINPFGWGSTVALDTTRVWGVMMDNPSFAVQTDYDSEFTGNSAIIFSDRGWCIQNGILRVSGVTTGQSGYIYPGNINFTYEIRGGIFLIDVTDVTI